MNWIIKHYKDLTKEELYQLLALRVEVFVVEQDCPYQDLDGKDQDCHHVMGFNEKGDLVATCRIVPKGMSYPEVAIGRVANDRSTRGKGVGRKLMEIANNFVFSELNETAIRISAQEYLEQFYTSLGYVATDTRYLEDGIPHVEMFQIKK